MFVQENIKYQLSQICPFCSVRSKQGTYHFLLFEIIPSMGQTQTGWESPSSWKRQGHSSCICHSCRAFYTPWILEYSHETMKHGAIPPVTWMNKGFSPGLMIYRPQSRGWKKASKICLAPAVSIVNIDWMVGTTTHTKTSGFGCRLPLEWERQVPMSQRHEAW